MILRRCVSLWILLFSLIGTAAVSAEEESIGKKVDDALEPIAKALESFIFYAIPVGDQKIPVVLILLAGTAIFLSLFFKFINVRGLGLALRTVRGKYSTKDSPGQITHFQALTTALSATVGLGNIAGVAIAISIGGPGAVLWMVIMGFLGMTSKFTECTLGVRYRRIDQEGRVFGGGMFYLRDGVGGKGGIWKPIGAVLAVIFAVACIGGALGAGNMFQINQAAEQVSGSFGIFESTPWVIGLIVAVLVGFVIIGGIVWIARVTEFLVPIMCITYLVACAAVLLVNIGDVPGALVTIVQEAFNPTAAAGGFIGGLIQGIRRGVFSNEAGVGSAGIAHAAVKTDKPASEGVVALLEPFVDTVVVCTMTALVIVVTGMWRVDSEVKVTSLEVLEQPAEGARSLVSYKEGENLKVESKWRIAEANGGERGWVKDGAIPGVKGKKDVYETAEEIALLKKPEGEDKAATLKVGVRVKQDPVWAKVKKPEESKDDEILGWVRFEDLNDRSSFSGGIWRTSEAFEGVISWFPKILAIAVFLFAFSTMISWSYYGEQALGYLTNENQNVALAYKFVFCACVVIGAAASLSNVLVISDSLFFAMVVPNLIGLYVLLPVVKSELAKFRAHAEEIDAKDSK